MGSRAPRTRSPRGARSPGGTKAGAKAAAVTLTSPGFAARRCGKRPHLRVEPGRDLGGSALRLPRLRAEPAPARRPLGRPVADARSGLGDGHLGALGQRVVPEDRRARLRRGRGCSLCLLPPVPPDAGGHRPGTRRPLRPGRDPRLARSRRRFVRASPPPRRGPPRRRRGQAGGSLPGGLPDERLPPGRVQRVALPGARTRHLRSRRAWSLARRRNHGGPRRADPHLRSRATSRARAASPGGGPSGGGHWRACAWRR